MKILKLSIPFIYTLHIICTHINEWQFSHFLWMLETMMLSFRGLFISIWYILDEIGPWSFNCRYNVVCCFKLIVTIFWSVLHKQLLLTNIDIIFYNLIVVRISRTNWKYITSNTNLVRNYRISHSSTNPYKRARESKTNDQHGTAYMKRFENYQLYITMWSVF